MILGIAAFTNVFGRFLHRELAGIPLNVILQYIVPLLAIPLVDRVQVREAAAIPLRLPRMAHQATDLLRNGTGFSTERDVPEGGPTRMPLTMRQHEANLHQPAFCELLPIRDYLDNVIVRSNGALVAGYDLGGINSYYHSDETRNQTKYSLEASVRSLTERSMRMQVRFEVVEGVGDLPRQVQGSAPLGQSGRAEPGSRPACCLEAEGGRSGFLSHADSARVLLLGSTDSS